MPVLLFPHSRMPISLLRGIITLFGPIRTFLPWFSESPEFTKDLPMEILNPPEGLKPKDSFRAVLSEYRLWAEQNRDRSFLETVKADRKGEVEESSTWQIRQLINRAFQSAENSREEEVLRRHIILHLAREVEEQYAIIDEIVISLKKRDPLLRGSVENPGDMEDLIGDLPALKEQSLTTAMNPERILEAWLGLFGGYLEDNEILISLNPLLMDYLSGIWEESATVFTLPDLSQFPRDRLDRIRTLISGISEDPKENLRELGMLSGESSRDSLRIMLKYLHPIPEESLSRGDRPLLKLFQKIFIHVEGL